ncbi:hypothetical protein GCM10025867_50000 (plasmid) [Frondihabitans sucicola]|uniref:Uncharacterized protein n=1 Tax=Frondihabitans sucicola TaxID=1268041 RepID=A0ABM8GWG0_9MICO|nr:hypothetical protein [Frondihabitans sucicola]BDZ52759.1 hypothetical protein GCM10025867_50000 [Frondihabitans sucicola]
MPKRSLGDITIPTQIALVIGAVVAVAPVVYNRLAPVLHLEAFAAASTFLLVGAIIFGLSGVSALIEVFRKPGGILTPEGREAHEAHFESRVQAAAADSEAAAGEGLVRSRRRRPRLALTIGSTLLVAAMVAVLTVFAIDNAPILWSIAVIAIAVCSTVVVVPAGLIVDARIAAARAARLEAERRATEARAREAAEAAERAYRESTRGLLGGFRRVAHKVVGRPGRAIAAASPPGS